MKSVYHDKKLMRAQIIRSIRDFFHEREFIECDTPSLVLCPGMEPHIRPLKVEGYRAYLPTSPEFAMKRLLAAGYEKIFQICRSYRDEPLSSTHNPEFAILEWYRAQAGYEDIMNDVTALLRHICLSLYGELHFETAAYGVQKLERETRRISIVEAFAKYAEVDLESRLLKTTAGMKDKEQFNDWFFKTMLDVVEPGLAKLGEPVILYGYPEFQAALSNLTEPNERGVRFAKRFELYAGGLEIANAFDELTDSAEQRRRFEEDMKLRSTLYGDGFAVNPMDEEFLACVDLLPRCGGIALGVDRLVMYFSGATDIKEVLWQPSFTER